MINFKDYDGEACFICEAPGEGHHYKTKGSGGPDVLENKLQLCRIHHRLCHDMPESEFLETFPCVVNWLIDNNWEVCPLTKKWFNAFKTVPS